MQGLASGVQACAAGTCQTYVGAFCGDESATTGMAMMCMLSAASIALQQLVKTGLTLRALSGSLTHSQASRQ